jgi:hypothetical protein
MPERTASPRIAVVHQPVPVADHVATHVHRQSAVPKVDTRVRRKGIMTPLPGVVTAATMGGGPAADDAPALYVCR